MEGGGGAGHLTEVTDGIGYLRQSTDMRTLVQKLPTSTPDATQPKWTHTTRGMMPTALWSSSLSRRASAPPDRRFSLRAPAAPTTHACASRMSGGVSCQETHVRACESQLNHSRTNSRTVSHTILLCSVLCLYTTTTTTARSSMIPTPTLLVRFP